MPSLTGKFETKAQILGMRLAKQVCCRPNILEIMLEGKLKKQK